jgi:hypothetical protein
MICSPSSQSYKWLRADGGWDIGRIIFCNGLVVTMTGLLKIDDLDGDDLVQVQTACAGLMWFVEWGRLLKMETRED